MQHVAWQQASVKGSNPRLIMNVYISVCFMMLQEWWILKFSLDFGYDQILQIYIASEEASLQSGLREMIHTTETKIHEPKLWIKPRSYIVRLVK
jgi:hypothetical protein